MKNQYKIIKMFKNDHISKVRLYTFNIIIIISLICYVCGSLFWSIFTSTLYVITFIKKSKNTKIFYKYIYFININFAKYFTSVAKKWRNAAEAYRKRRLVKSVLAIKMGTCQFHAQLGSRNAIYFTFRINHWLNHVWCVHIIVLRTNHSTQLSTT